MYAGGEIISSTIVVTQIDYITIATTGNSLSFGNLTQARQGVGACGSPVNAVFGGGVNYSGGTTYSVIDYVAIPTLSNASNFGSMSTTKGFIGGCSNVHGGL